MALQLSKVYKMHYDKIKDKSDVSLVEKYIPFLLDYASYKTKAGRGYYQFEEVLSICMAAAVKATKTYKAHLGDFSTYVKPFINGAIVDYYRNSSKRSADVKRKILAFVSMYEKEHKHFPTENTIVKELRLSKATFDVAVSDISAKFIDIDHVSISVDPNSSSIIFDSIRTILSSFDPVVADIFELKLFDGESDQQVAAILCIPTKQVVQLFNQNIGRLRQLLEDNHITLDSYYESLAKNQQDI